jgi:hypothetical protein
MGIPSPEATLDFSPLFMAYSLSGAAGIRSALTMLIVSIGVSTGYFHPDPSLAWVGSSWFMALAFVATIIEFFGDKVPALDHALHALHVALAPLAGALTSASGGGADPVTTVAFGILGGGNALLVHMARATVRVGSTATTAGLANPAISLFEDGIVVCFIVIAVLAPWLTALLLVLFTVWVVKAISRLRPAKRRTQ